jgi:hypothetical protein
MIAEAHKGPDELLRGLSSENQKEGENQEFKDIGPTEGENEGNGGTREEGNQGKCKTTKKKREFMAYKYSNRKKEDLHEAIILSGKPVFLKCENGLIKAVDRVEEGCSKFVPTIIPPFTEAARTSYGLANYVISVA